MILAVVLSIDVTRTALFDTVGGFSTSAQAWLINSYYTTTTHPIYVQYHILILGAFFIGVTLILVKLWNSGKLRKVQTAYQTPQPQWNQQPSTTIPVSPTAQNTPTPQPTPPPPAPATKPESETT